MASYIGVSQDIGDRYLRHNMGGTTSTRNRRPFILIYIRRFENKPDAQKYERYTKTPAGGRELRLKLIELHMLNEDGELTSKKNRGL